MRFLREFMLLEDRTLVDRMYRIMLKERKASLTDQVPVLGYSVDGKPFTSKDLEKAIEEAEEERRNGTLTSIEDFMKEIETW